MVWTNFNICYMRMLPHKVFFFCQSFKISITGWISSKKKRLNGIAMPFSHLSVTFQTHFSWLNVQINAVCVKLSLHHCCPILCIGIIIFCTNTFQDMMFKHVSVSCTLLWSSSYFLNYMFHSGFLLISGWEVVVITIS